MLKIAKFIVGTMGTNCYFLIDESTSKAAVVDPGAECEKILEKLAARGLTCEKILLTHGHFDHIMALEELREATKAPVYIHGADAELLSDPEKSYMRQFAGISASCRAPEVTLSEGDSVSIGSQTMTVLHTPGHTQGSVCYDDGEHLICGDTLFKGGMGRYDLYGGDFATLTQSLRRIAELPGDRSIYPGHGMSGTLSSERENNMYLYL